jgi:hypothetical protein
MAATEARNCHVCGDGFRVLVGSADLTCGDPTCEEVLRQRLLKQARANWERDRMRFVVERCRAHWKEAKAAGR